MASAGETLKYEAWQSLVETQFWTKLAKLKLDELHLSEAPLPLTGYFLPSQRSEIASPLWLDDSSLETEQGPHQLGRSCAHGTLVVTNTVERFKAFDRDGAMAAAAARLVAAIESGAAASDPALLSPFLLVSYPDLKQYSFLYWFSFPALQLPAPIVVSASGPAAAVFGAAAADAALSASAEWRARTQGQAEGGPAPVARPAPAAWAVCLGSDGNAEAHALGEWTALKAAGRAPLLAYADSGSDPTHPGWALRNLLALAAAGFGERALRVLACRTRDGRFDATASLVFDLQLPAAAAADLAARSAVGWERNTKGILAPRILRLGATLDPQQRAASAVDLNLKLMRWRLFPDLQADKLSNTKCLLLGAGTLGCAVARTLLGWGVRHITLVDSGALSIPASLAARTLGSLHHSGNVSFSNPVRQWLFNLDDCLDGGKPKAEAAAAALTRIFPGAKAQGVRLSVPMPGHFVPAADEAATLADADRLADMVRDHDVVFLLTDTRESRWLPTLLCASEGRTALTAALGFDSFLVMRHGAGVGADAAAPQAEGRLGCYFCNDVVAPANSTVDRTLDQQCTVTRPGLAPVASALAVEMAVSLIHAPLGAATPPPAAAGGRMGDASGNSQEADSTLGRLPHQVRGFLSRWDQLCVASPAFEQCTACSRTAVGAFRADRKSFLLGAFNKSSYLEDLTGLTELHNAAEAATAAWEALDEGGSNDGGSDDVDDF